MTKQIRLGAVALSGALGLTLLTPGMALAGSKGKQNTALVLGAVTAYGIIKKKPVIAGVAGAGAIYSYMQSRKDASRERARRRNTRYRRANYRSGYDGRRYASYGGHQHYDGCEHRRSSGPPGWSRGRKTGWGGHSVPPGHAKKHRH